jgi:hypothetical protein
MAIAQAAQDTVGASSSPKMKRLLIDNLSVFCRQSDEIIQRGYHEIIRGEPTAKLLEAYRQELQWSLRLARVFHRVTSAPDFDDASLAALLEARLRQLEEHWKYIFELPSKEEAEKLEGMLREFFPDESRA